MIVAVMKDQASTGIEPPWPSVYECCEAIHVDSWSIYLPGINYSLMHSASEISRFTCTSFVLNYLHSFKKN